MHNNHEILAPAGSVESFHAAIRAQADAIYLGGNRFSARAFAGNFNDAELLQLIDYAHLHGVKVYLTVNTLLKDREIKDLYDYILPLYQQGLDAVIVQDVGVAYYLQSNFPLLEIHASTQMTITNYRGAIFLKENGFSRLVPARELSIREVEDIITHTGLEVECFVHGAMCYCYSGQCFMSSMIGGRSGNRGQCAQPCRMLYKLGGRKQYYLSLKDLNTLEILPDLIDIGVSSFKIEGRMKKPEYVALVTSLYVKYRDLYLSQISPSGISPEHNAMQKHDTESQHNIRTNHKTYSDYEKSRWNYQVDPKDQIHLMDTFNRGGFTEGYYHQHNDQSMLSFDRPNHAGTAVIRIVRQVGRELHGITLLPISKGDVIDLGLQSLKESSYTFGQEYDVNQDVSVLLPKGIRIKVGTILYRVRNQKLINTIQDEVISRKPYITLHATLTLNVGSCAVFNIYSDSFRVSVHSEQVVQAAEKMPVTKERIIQQLCKTKATEFCFESIEVDMDDQVFISMTELNQLRREALETLEQELLSCYRRNPIQQKQLIHEDSIHRKIPEDTTSFISIQVENIHQFQAIIPYTFFHKVYLPMDILQTCTDICNDLRTRAVLLYVTTPIIYRELECKRWLQEFSKLSSEQYDGILISNMELYVELRHMRDQFDKDIILDHNLYIFNDYSRRFWQNNGQMYYTAPLELNQKELKQLGMSDMELIIYGRVPVMITAQCLTEEVEGCTRIPQLRYMEDRKGNQLPVCNVCQYCYNVIYSHEASYLFDLLKELESLIPRSLRITFTMEDQEQVMQVMDRYLQKDFMATGETRGHFTRGVT